MAANTRLPRKLASFLADLPHSRSFIAYSQPGDGDQQGKDYDAPRPPDLSLLQQLHLPQTADFYLCGPPAFLTELTAALQSWGVPVLTHPLRNLRNRICCDSGHCGGRAENSASARRQPRAPVRKYPLPGVVCRCRGIHGFKACSNSRKPAMFLSGGRAGQASAICASPG